jgi:hypothetical protein
VRPLQQIGTVGMNSAPTPAEVLAQAGLSTDEAVALVMRA